MKCALTDERISQKCERALSMLGFHIIKIKGSKNLSESVKSHPDMIMFYHNNTLITSAEYCESAPYIFTDIREFLPDVNIRFTDDVLSPVYPKDAVFNALSVGNRLFIKEDTVSGAIKEYALSYGLKTVNVRQGYPACTVLAFGECAITSDKGMARTLKDEGIDVTLIENGDISLPPFEYGFIGGAAGVFRDKVYFLGDYKTHRNSDIIEKAIKNAGYTPVSLSDEPLADLGRIIFI